MYKIYLLLVHWFGSEFTNFGSCWVQVSLKEIYAQVWVRIFKMVVLGSCKTQTDLTHWHDKTGEIPNN